MPIIDEKTRRFAANSMFPSCFYAALGFVLAEVGAVQMHGAWGLHVLLGAPGLALLGLALFRVRLHWPAVSAGMPPVRPRALVWYLLLLVAGTSVGVLVSAGSLLLLGVIVASTYSLPWMKIPVCRARFAVSALVMLTGAVAWVLTHGRPVQPLYFVIAAWMLYFPAMSMHFFVLVSLNRDYRIGDSRPAEMPDLDRRVPLAR